MKLTETGTLPYGVEYDGRTHRNFELREERLRDTLDICNDPETVKKAEGDNQFYNLAILCRRLKLGDIPAEAITPEMLLDMDIDDYAEINNAKTRLEERRKSFRDGGSDASQGGAVS